jgi:hypothetical protein
MLFPCSILPASLRANANVFIMMYILGALAPNHFLTYDFLPSTFPTTLAFLQPFSLSS